MWSFWRTENMTQWHKKNLVTLWNNKIGSNKGPRHFLINQQLIYEENVYIFLPCKVEHFCCPLLAPRTKAHFLTPSFTVTSLCSLCCLIDSSSLRLSSLRAFASSASSSVTRWLRVAQCSRLWASSLLVRSSSSWSSDALLPSSWASIEPLGSLCKADTYIIIYTFHIKCISCITQMQIYMLCLEGIW